MSHRSVLRHREVCPGVKLVAVLADHGKPFSVVRVFEYSFRLVETRKVSVGRDPINYTPYSLPRRANNTADAAFPLVAVSWEAKLLALRFRDERLEYIPGIRTTLTHLSDVHVGTIRKNQLNVCHRASTLFYPHHSTGVE